MAKTDVFNPATGMSAQLGFNPNWDYKSPRRTPKNYTGAQPMFGAPSNRLTGDKGYAFDLIFSGRSMQQVRYIKRFYEQFQSGYFTIIDHDNHGREHAGRFTVYADDTETQNVEYTVRVTFEELQGADMRNYPSNWAEESHMSFVVDDAFNTRAGVSGGGWLVQQRPEIAGAVSWFVGSPPVPAAVDFAMPLGGVASTFEVYKQGAVAGDFAQIAYTGWGFRLALRTAANLGQCSLVIDGQPVLAMIDLAAATVTTGGSVYIHGVEYTFAGPAYINGVAVTVHVSGAGPLYIHVDLPLGWHRVKLMALGTKSNSSTDTGIFFPAIEVMH